LINQAEKLTDVKLSKPE